jgi:hypothetical protein
MSRVMPPLRLPAVAAAALLALCAAAGGIAQDAPSVGDGALRYEVEILVFRHLDQSGTTGETAPPSAGATLRADVVPGAGGAASTGPAGVAWPALAPATLKLGSIATRLRRGGPYELLFHGGWIQELQSESRSAPAALPEEALRAGVRGTVWTFRERFLHARVDVGLVGADGRADPLRWIRQSRRLRGSLQYFDNPALGVILAVRPVGDEPLPEPR